MPKAPLDLKSLARTHTDMAVRTLAGIAAQTKAAPAARVAAAQALLDRGWGKAEQAHVGPDGGDIVVTIRQIIENTGQSPPVPGPGDQAAPGADDQGDQDDQAAGDK